MADSAPRSSGPFRQILSLCFIGLMAVYITKIYLRDPNYRHVEVCYMPYKLAHRVWVDAWGGVFTDDTATLLKHSEDLSQFFESCTERLRDWSPLRDLGLTQ
jgi:hypothetical protein